MVRRMADRFDNKDRPGPGDVLVEVFAAADFRVCMGIRLGDALGGVDDVTEGDVYTLRDHARAQRLLLPVDGRPNASDPAHPIARHTLMSSRGDMVSIVVLQRRGERLILPQSPLLARQTYTLIASSAQTGPLQGLGPVLAAFSGGTSIIMGDGSTRRIETLAPGDRVLTRDHGPQLLRWIGQSTMAGGGPLAPVVFRAGSMGNPEDLIVAPTQRMFVFPRSTDPDWAGLTGERQGILVEARHLVDRQTIQQLSEGIYDLYALVFDQHEIIYAEGIPCESHLVTEATLRQMPEPMARELRDRFPGLRHRPHYALGED